MVDSCRSSVQLRVQTINELVPSSCQERLGCHLHRSETGSDLHESPSTHPAVRLRLLGSALPFPCPYPCPSHPYSHSCLNPAFPRRTSTLAAECSLSVIRLQYAEQYPPGTPGWIPFIRGSQSRPALPGARPVRGNLSVPCYNPIPGSIMSKCVGFALDGYIQETNTNKNAYQSSSCSACPCSSFFLIPDSSSRIQTRKRKMKSCTPRINNSGI